MTLSVYSHRIYAEAGLNGSYVYTVPAGYVLVLRDIDAYANVTLASREIHVLGSAGQTIWWHAWNSTSNAQETAQWRGRQVLIAGETLTFTTSDLIDITASGYLLATP